MSKLLKSIVFLLLMVAWSFVLVEAQDIAVKSDIVAYIDYTPINSYNINGYTYIIAEDLFNYGFDVVWNEEQRTLNVNRVRLSTPMYTKELWQKSNVKSDYYDIYQTDIKTYVDGCLVNSYNIGGQTVLQIDEFAKYGGFIWDEENRVVSVTIFQNELQSDFDNAKNIVEIGDDKGIASYSKYTGQVNKDNIPNGIGIRKVRNGAASAGLSYSIYTYVLGYFKDGKSVGNVFKTESLSSDKIGYYNDIYFIGEIDGEKKAERKVEFIEKGGSRRPQMSRGNNFGVSPLPIYYMTDYMGIEVFSDNSIYLKGVWSENHISRGRKVGTYMNWYNGNDYQTILSIESFGYSATNINKIFTEYINATKVFSSNE